MNTSYLTEFNSLMNIIVFRRDEPQCFPSVAHSGEDVDSFVNQIPNMMRASFQGFLKWVQHENMTFPRSLLAHLNGVVIRRFQELQKFVRIVIGIQPHQVTVELFGRLPVFLR